ncbi:hypothetical protein BDV23DRAFT_145951 [Aspergillus alliaceus]|uniref:Uncharacterized protein n=1 Tax=Petromyces alliaceus TaxID=209559 RepID=A0A5N7CL49_PETAA|nr:hypothetical protein BDV23DRAFT_145951 [Aspergillus alliaceus]
MALSNPPPPQYGAETSPPSYEELVERFKAAVGDNPTAEKYLEVADSFGPKEIDVLADSCGDGFPPVESEEDLNKLKESMSKELKSELVRASAKAASVQAKEAALRIRAIFNLIHRKIVQLDLIEESEFEEEMRGFIIEYDEILSMVGEVAREMKGMGNHLDTLLIPTCASEKVSKEAKVQLVKNFLRDTERHEGISAQAQYRISEMKIKFNEFVAKFDQWGEKREGELREEIRKLQGEIRGLRDDITRTDQQIQDLQFAMKLIGSLSLFGLLFGGLVAVILGIVSVIGVAATAIAIAAKRKKIASLDRQILGKENEISELEKEIQIIQAARAALTTLRDSNLDTISEDILLVDNYWQGLKATSLELLSYVEDGTAMEYIDDVIDFGIETYRDVGEYIGDYGEAISRVMSERREESDA